MRRALQPVRKIMLGHPAPPADLEPLVEIELIHFEDYRGPRQYAEVNELADEGIPISLLQGVVELIIPAVEQDCDDDKAELGRDQPRKQSASRPAVLRTKKRNRKPPDG